MGEPFLSVVVGGDGGDHSEWIHVADLIDVDGFVYSGACLLVGGDDVGYLQSGDVEGFAGRYAHHCLAPCRVGHSSERSVVQSVEYEFTVDLVGNHRHSVVCAYLGDAQELILTPYPACRIVGIAEEHEGGVGIRCILLQTLEVDVVGVAFPYERTFEDHASVVAYGGEEAVIDRGLHDYVFSRLRQSLDDG